MKHRLYPHLFSPLKVNGIVLKNRIIAAPVGGYPNTSLAGYGLIIRGVIGNVDGPRMRPTKGKFYLDDPKRKNEFIDEIATIRQRGSKASLELCHAGMKAYVEKGDYVLGPSQGVRDDGIEIREMTEDMMHEVAKQFASAAVRQRDVGVDVIMMHFAHGWLATQFLSPLTNKRTDQYGGSIENRGRFPRMIIEEVRKALGPDYPIDMRISIAEYKEGGSTPEEIMQFVKSVEDLIDMVSISCGYLDTKGEYEPTRNKMITPSYEPHMVNVQYSEKLKQMVHIPVAVVGAIMTPEEAEEIIATGKADAVVIGRAIVADPYWAKKAYECRSEDIVPCIRCMKCRKPSCTVSPWQQRSHRLPVEVKEEAEVKKNVMIVGGGPAGLKAAITASLRGHHVELYEKSDRLGGQINCSDYDHYKQDLKRYRDYLLTQIHKSNVIVHLNQAVTPDLVQEKNPDSLVIAIGAEATKPRIEGIDQPHVIQAIDAYPNLEAIGKRVVIIGGGTVGCELSLTLAESGHDVSVVEISDQLDASNVLLLRMALKERIEKMDNIKNYLETAVTAIQENGVIIKNAEGESFLEADTVILATGFKVNIDFISSFYGIVDDTCVIGDAVRPASVEEATLDGYQIGLNL